MFFPRARWLKVFSRSFWSWDTITDMLQRESSFLRLEVLLGRRVVFLWGFWHSRCCSDLFWQINPIFLKVSREENGRKFSCAGFFFMLLCESFLTEESCLSDEEKERKMINNLLRKNSREQTAILSLFFVKEEIGVFSSKKRLQILPVFLREERREWLMIFFDESSSEQVTTLEMLSSYSQTILF